MTSRWLGTSIVRKARRFGVWTCIAAALITVEARGQITTITESATSSAYNSTFTLSPSPNPNGFTSSWTELATGGGRFTTTGGAAVGSGRSWGIFSGVGTDYALGRTLSNSAAVGSISLVMRHNVDNGDGFTGFNLKTTGAAAFNNGEILSVGLSPAGGNNAVRYNPGTPQSLAFGSELRGQVMTYTAAWNTVIGTFSLSASRNGAMPLTASGSLSTAAPVLAFGFANFNSGSNQDVIWNDLSISIPEPSQYRATLPAVGTNQGFLTYSQSSPPQSLTLASPVSRGFVTINSIDALPSGLPQFALSVPGASLTRVVALLGNRAAVNGYTVSTTPPDWVATLPDASAFNVFLQYASTPVGERYLYWDLEAAGSSVSAVAVAPEPAIGFVLPAVWVACHRRRRIKPVK